MADLYFGVVLMFFISTLLFLFGYQIACGSPRWVSNVLGSLTIVGLVAYAVYLRDNVLLARLFPYSNLIILGNWFPPAVGFLGGLAMVRVYGGVLRRSLYTLALLLVGLYAMVRPMLGEPPKCDNVWQGEICVQTSRATCSPACAATILAAAGFEAEEGELARLCLTRKGTTWQGLYRGLKLKTRGTGWDVEVFSCDPDELAERVKTPAILAVGIPSGRDVDPKYREYGWIPGQLHSVVLFRFYRNKLAAIADPTPDVVSEVWTQEDLNVLWRGIGLRLVPREEKD